MPVEPRPTNQNTVTLENFLIGMPVVEFAPLSGGVLQPYIPLGIVDNAALQKELETLEMEDGAPGLRATVLEIVSKISPTLSVGVFNFSADLLRFVLGGATLTAVSADAAAAITDERVPTTTDPEDFVDLDNRLLNSGSVVVSAARVNNEAVGTGDGTTGDGSGDFSLDYKVNAVGDIVGTIDVNNAGVITNYTAVAVGAAASGNEVEVVVGYGATSGDLQFHSGGSPVNVTGDITATYQPSFTLVEGLTGGALTAIEAGISDDGGALTDETADANSAAANDVVLLPAVPAANDAFYVGMTDQFNRITVNVGTAGTGGNTVVWEYSQGGGTWAALTLVTDETNGFETAGTGDVTYAVPSDWVQDTVNSQGPFHYIRARVTTSGGTGGVGTQVWTSQSEDYIADLKNGRVQVHHEATKATGPQPIIAEQEVFVDYTYNSLARNEFQPFTQNTFDGAIRIRHITDQGANLTWDVPSGQIQVSDEDLTWDDENFMVGPVTLTIKDAGGTDRFGTIKHFTKTAAGN